MRQGIRRIGREERGASMVEMAMATLLLLLLLAGVADMGRAFHDYIIITNAAREGARYGSMVPHLADRIRLAAKDEAAGSGIFLEDYNILIVPEPPPGALPGDPSVAQPGEPIWVGVEYHYKTMMVGVLGFDEFTLHGATQMVVMGQGQE
jgi:Flp pilus assembly pilin Flp